MKSEVIVALLTEASHPGCTDYRKEEIREELYLACVGDGVIGSKAFRLGLLCDELFRSLMKQPDQKQIELSYRTFFLLCGEKEAGMSFAPVEPPPLRPAA